MFSRGSGAKGAEEGLLPGKERPGDRERPGSNGEMSGDHRQSDENLAKPPVQR